MIPNRSLAHIAEQLSAPLIIADPQGRVTWMNSAFSKLCGYTLEEMRGHPPGLLLRGPETDPNAARELREAIRQVRSTQVEIVNYHRSGKPYLVSINLDPLYDEKGQHVGFMALEKELTATHHQLRRLESEVTELYSILCHVNGGATA